jgi:hypothetical protein
VAFDRCLRDVLSSLAEESLCHLAKPHILSALRPEARDESFEERQLNSPFNLCMDRMHIQTIVP